MLLDICERKKISLISPENWEDKNDVNAISYYKQLIGKESLLASCFTYGKESIHEWSYFSKGIAGCMIEIYAEDLIKQFENENDLLLGVVDYLEAIEIEESIENLKIEDIPFLKRAMYKCENEFRFVKVSNKKIKKYDVDFPLSLIKRIRFSQYLPEEISKSVKNLINRNYGLEIKNMKRSLIYDSDNWLDAAKKIRDN